MNEDIEQKTESLLDFAYTIMSRKLEMLKNANNSLENKAGILLGFVGIIAASTVILIRQDTSMVGLNIFTIGLAGIYVTFLLLMVASQTRIYFDPPDFPAFYSEEALKKKPADFKNQVIADMKSSYELNINNQKTKSKLYNIGAYCFVGSMFLLLLGILE